MVGRTEIVKLQGKTVIGSGLKMVDKDTFKQIKKSNGRKTSKRQRLASALERKRFKFPLLTGAALALPLFHAMEAAKASGGLQTTAGLQKAALSMIKAYTGIDINLPFPELTKFDPKALLIGLGPLAVIGFASKFGVFRKANMILAGAKVPLRLN